MSLLQAMFGQSQPLSDPDHWIVRAIGQKTKSGIYVNEFSALNLPVVYACVSRITNPIGMFPIQIFRRGDDGEAVEDREHSLNVILRRRPNPFMNARTMKKTSQAHALLWGNGYLEIQRTNGGDRAAGLWPLLPWNTTPYKSGDRLTYRTQIDNKVFELPDRNVIHLMDLSLDGYCGLSQIQLARSSIGLAQAAEQFGEKFFANDAKSGGFLQHPGKLGDKAVANIQQGMHEQGGLDNAHRVKILEEGMKYVSQTIPPDDAQFLSTREFQTAEIARVYNVPLFLLQSHERDTAWGSGLEQMMIAFLVHTLQPWTDAWEQELNWKLFTEEEREQGYFVKFNMNALLRGDMKARAEFYNAGIDHGWMVRAEAREKEDLPPIEGLDEPVMNANLMPANRAPENGNDNGGNNA